VDRCLSASSGFAVRADRRQVQLLRPVVPSSQLPGMDSRSDQSRLRRRAANGALPPLRGRPGSLALVDSAVGSSIPTHQVGPVGFPRQLLGTGYRLSQGKWIPHPGSWAAIA